MRMLSPSGDLPHTLFEGIYLDKRSKLFWSNHDMEPRPALEKDTTRPELMQATGHARERVDEH